jgi:DNA-binding NarL/FixJ family response regulator
MSIRVLLVDDNSAFLEAAARFLATDPQIQVVGAVSSGAKALEQVKLLHPNLVLMNLTMDGMNGLEATRHLKAGLDPPRVIILTLYDNPEYRTAAELACADGFVAKSDLGDNLLPFIHHLFPGQTGAAAPAEKRMAPLGRKDTPMTHNHALWAMTDLHPGDQLCCLYKTEEEHRAMLTPFLRQGLEQGEKVLYIADAHSAETILAYLREDGLAVEPYLARGQLALLTRDDAYVRDGVFDPDSMIALLRAETEQARAEGYTALRVMGEMPPAAVGLPGSRRLIVTFTTSPRLLSWATVTRQRSRAFGSRT